MAYFAYEISRIHLLIRTFEVLPVLTITSRTQHHPLPLIERVGKDKICDYFISRKCGGHFNPKGYELLADIAYHEIQRIKPLYESKKVSH